MTPSEPAPHNGSGYHVYAGVSLELAPDAKFDLGAVRGDDGHCRRVCASVPGCNVIMRRPGALACVLSAACVASPSLATARLPPGASLSCGAGAVTMLAATCRQRAAWHKLKYRLENEGSHLAVVIASSQRCREVCDAYPGCNSFALDRTRGGPTRCHLKAMCADPAGEQTSLDKPSAPAASRVKLLRLRHMVTHYRWPCTTEPVLFPLPGARRTLPPGQPTTVVCLL